jgi:NADH-quinone oxidoreductase subunit L
MVNFLDLIWLIPLVPLAGAAIMLFLGRLFPKSVISILCPGTVLISFLISAGAVLQLTGTPGKAHEVVQFLWLPAVGAQWGFFLDPLSSVMILVVTGIGFLIHVYSIGYMGHEGGYYRFFGYLNLFVFFMLMLVLANNYLLLFVGWEGVGLCSYLLIGFYFDRKSAGDAGKKAFIVNRIGDAGFLIGMLLVWQLTGSLRFINVNHALEHGNFTAETAAWGILSTTALLLFVGATGKSAQFPLYVWLPDAMEGPTPVSALIHAATMVTAGVYVVCRSHVLFELAPMTSNIVAVIGAFTAIFAATIGIAQNDIKRVLAYSTVSQLGYMFLAAGVGAYWVAIFHLFTHAFFKALLFLGAGSVIHGCGGEQDMRKMGGLKKYMPVTHAVMFIATLAISGIPGLAGFFSKDEILAQVWGSVHGSKVLYVVGLTTAAMTAFYMWRLMYMTFYGEQRSHVHAHESPKVMTVPLMVLALGSIVAGWFAVPRWWTFFPDSFRFFETWLANVFGREAGPHIIPDVPLTLASVGAALLGIFVASRLHLKVWEGPIYRAMQNKWYVDEIYDFLFVNGLAKGGGQLLADFDNTVVDGGVNGAGWMTRVGSLLSIWWDTWIVDGTVRLSSFAVKLAGYPVRLAQNGYVQSYALVFVAGVVAMIGYYFVR